MARPWCYQDKVKRPSEQLEDLLMGRMTWEQTPEPIRSLAQFYIHDAAKQCMAGENKAEQIRRFNRLPDYIRPHVSKEVRRLKEGR